MFHSTVTISALQPGWNSPINLPPNARFILIPDEASTASIDGGRTISDFHGLGDLDGAPYQIPGKVRYGGLMALFLNNHDGSIQLDAFPVPKGFAALSTGPAGGIVSFCVVDSPNPGLYADNTGGFRVTVQETDQQHVDMMDTLHRIAVAKGVRLATDVYIRCAADVAAGAAAGAGTGNPGQKAIGAAVWGSAAAISSGNCQQVSARCVQAIRDVFSSDGRHDGGSTRTHSGDTRLGDHLRGDPGLA